jgi:sterol desaturase/sphingolipid hydroxylase (fatty acid hydroxylase superfamily)
MMEGRDWWFMMFNKCYVPVFAYHTLRYAWRSPNVAWACGEASALNTVGAVAMLFVVYDFFYSLFHRALHVRSVYGYIHKHHHQQVAPSHGIEDAINEHPVRSACAGCLSNPEIHRVDP